MTHKGLASDGHRTCVCDPLPTRAFPLPSDGNLKAYAARGTDFTRSSPAPEPYTSAYLQRLKQIFLEPILAGPRRIRSRYRVPSPFKAPTVFNRGSFSVQGDDETDPRVASVPYSRQGLPDATGHALPSTDWLSSVARMDSTLESVARAETHVVGLPVSNKTTTLITTSR